LECAVLDALNISEEEIKAKAASEILVLEDEVIEINCTTKRGR
jgi:hypothetical protein